MYYLICTNLIFVVFFEELVNEDRSIICTALGESIEEFKAAAEKAIHGNDLMLMLTTVAKALKSAITKTYSLRIVDVLFEHKLLDEVVEIFDKESKRIWMDRGGLIRKINILLVILLNICRTTNNWRSEITAIHANLKTIASCICTDIQKSKYAAAIKVLLQSIERLVNFPAKNNNEDDISSYSIFPTVADIEHKSFTVGLKNVTDCSYQSKEEYLKVHFHLLREDFINPLREGIHKLRHELQFDRFTRNFDNIEVYYNVLVLRSFYGEGKKTVELLLNTHCLNLSSDQLKYGTLVGLSKDNFQTYRFAVVLSNEELRTHGKVQLGFEFIDSDLYYFTNESITMVEPTTAYFESYRHTLEALQKLSVQQFQLPFENYIVFCNKQIGSPKYLKSISSEVSKYKSQTCETSLNQAEHITAQPTHSNATKFESNLIYHRTKILHKQPKPMNSLTVLESPTKKSFDMHQLVAFQTAISKDISLIQDPPGCGKTFLGLEIVKHLADKTDLKELRYNIMIVCYTNHALDQFLEGLLKTHGADMIRVGNRSQSSKIKNITVKEKRNVSATSKVICKLQYKQRSLKDERAIVSHEISANLLKQDILKNNIINTATLAQEMGNFYKYFHCDEISEKGNSVMCEWLLGLVLPKSVECNCYNLH